MGAKVIRVRSPLQGVKTVLEKIVGCFVREDGTLDRDKLEEFWRKYVNK